MVFIKRRTTNQSEMDVYSELAPHTAAGHPMTMLAGYGRQEVLEGDPIEGAVIMRFPTNTEAKAFYDSPGYQAAAAHRHAGADYDVFIVEGVD